MIQIKNVTKTYSSGKNGKAQVRALDGVSLDFPERGMVFLLGKSGSGKSTLLNVCGGLDTPTEGEIVVKGRSSKTFSQSDFDSYRNTYIGFIFQEYNILDEFSVADNLALALELQGKAKDDALIGRLLKDVDLEGYESRKPNTLSGGQKQRIAIARALIKSPEIIMADEPTGALDSETGKQVFDTLKKLSKDKLVLVVSHDREFAEKYGDRIIQLKDGKVISDVSKNEQQDEFFETAQEEVSNKTYKEEEQRFVRSKLSIRHAGKIGVSSLKAKPVRLAFTLILSILTFMIFGLFSTLTFYNAESTIRETFSASNLSTVKLEKRAQTNRKTYSYGVLQDEYVGTNSTAYFSETELSQYATTFESGVFGGAKAPSTLSFETRKESNYWFDYLSAFAYLPEGHALRGEIIYGKYPENEGELCITSYVAESMLNRQLKLRNNEILEADSIDDLLEKEFYLNYKTYRIVGIIQSEAIPNEYGSLKNVVDLDEVAFDLQQDLKDYLEDGWHLVGFVTQNEVAALANQAKKSIEFEYNQNRSFCYATQKNTEGGYDFSDTYYPNGKYNAYSKLLDKSDMYFFQEGKTTLADNEVLVPSNEWLSRLDQIDELYTQALTEYTNHAIYDRTPFINSLLLEFPDKDYSYISGVVAAWEMELYENPQAAGPQQGEAGHEVYQDWRTTFEPIRLLWEEAEYYRTLKESVSNLYRNGEIVYVGNEPVHKEYTKDERAALVEEILLGMKEIPFNDTLKIRLCDEETQIGYGEVVEYTIVGVYGLYDYENAIADEFYLNENENTKLWDIQKVNLPQYQEITSKYVTNENEIYNVVFVSYSHSKNETDLLVDIWKNDMKFNEQDVRFMIDSSFVSHFSLVNSMVERFSSIFLYVGVAFAVFTALLLSNFITVSISQKKKDIGILRALGARGVDVFKIFFSESLIITLICIVISITGSLLVCQIANTYVISIIGAAIFVFGIPSVLVLMGVALLTVCIATFVPVYFEAKKKPVESIRKV